jgi:hypothetical protein
MRTVIMSGLVLALGLTAGCAERERRAAAGGAGGFCTPFATAAATPADPTAQTIGPAGAATPALAGEAASFDDCLHRWGYRLARSEEDSADVVAQAVVAACAPALVRWNQQTLSQIPAGGSDSAVSLVTGRTATTPEDRYEMSHGKALFYVVQARAGNCPAP